MYIGIVHQELIFGYRTRVFHPSLIVMQLSTYLKSQNNIVELVTDLNHIERYSKIYLVKMENNKRYINELISNPKVELIGPGFTNGVYYGNPEFDNVEPDTTIYDRVKNKFKANESKTNYSKLKHYTNTRLSLDGKTITCNCEPNTKIALYDNNIADIPGAVEFMKEKNFKNVYVLNPVVVDDFDELLKWTQIKNVANINHRKLIYSKQITEEEIERFNQLEQVYFKPTFLYGDYKTPEENKYYFWYFVKIGNEIKLKQRLPFFLRKTHNDVDYYDYMFQMIADWYVYDGNHKNFWERFEVESKIKVRSAKFWKEHFYFMCKKNPKIFYEVKRDLRGDNNG